VVLEEKLGERVPCEIVKLSRLLLVIDLVILLALEKAKLVLFPYS
jgi:hypothetical protein